VPDIIKPKVQTVEEFNSAEVIKPKVQSVERCNSPDVSTQNNNDVLVPAFIEKEKKKFHN